MDSNDHLLVYCLSGMGQFDEEMGKELYDRIPLFQASIHECDFQVKNSLGFSLIDDYKLFKPSNGSKRDSLKPINVAIEELAIISFQLSLMDVMSEILQIQPLGVIGHSLGEVTSLYAANLLDKKSAMFIGINRAEIIMEFYESSNFQGHSFLSSLSPSHSSLMIYHYNRRNVSD